MTNLCHGSVSRAWRTATLPLRQVVLDVLAGFDGSMSTRQVYYQVVSHAGLPNCQKSYLRVARLVLQMRRAGDIPYGRIVDRGRAVHRLPGWDGAVDFMRSVAPQYRRDIWTDQPAVAMVACEKAALEGVFTEQVDEYGASLWTCRGFPSESFLYDWSQTIEAYSDNGQTVVIGYFGDLDPSGLAIADHAESTLRGFGADFEFIRLGLLPSDIETYSIPALPLKKSDTRSRSYRKRYGDIAAELDALPPNVLRKRIADFIEVHIDADRLERMRVAEAAEQASINMFAKAFQAGSAQ